MARRLGSCHTGVNLTQVDCHGSGGGGLQSGGGQVYGGGEAGAVKFTAEAAGAAGVRLTACVSGGQVYAGGQADEDECGRGRARLVRSGLWVR